MFHWISGHTRNQVRHYYISDEVWPYAWVPTMIKSLVNMFRYGLDITNIGVQMDRSLCRGILRFANSVKNRQGHTVPILTWDEENKTDT
jgi:hypothetical protein